MKIASCFVEHDGKLLVVARRNDKTDTYEWDVPADTVQPHESGEDTALRVLAIEAGLETSPEALSFVAKTDFISRYNEPYEMHVYRVVLD